MALKNPVATITDAARGAAALPLRVIASGARVAASLISSTAERAKPGPVGAPAVASRPSVEDLAEAAVAREMAQEPLTTPTAPKAARSTAPTKAGKPKTVSSTGTSATSKRTAASPEGAQPDDKPLIDPATAKAVKSETDILRAAADRDKDL